VPVLLGLVTLAAFAATPVQNAVSRAIEARADAHALDLTGDARTFISAQQRLAASNLTHLQPNPVLAFWFNSHPAPLERIGMAEQWRHLHELRQ
jgi:STE24 endopeptidase